MFHCSVSSPPYHGQRSYLPEGHPLKHLEIGSENTIEEYIQHLIEVYREVRRVLRDDGVVWINLGDRYTSGGRRTYDRSLQSTSGFTNRSAGVMRPVDPDGLKKKDLCLLPFRVAMALQADGWYLRAAIPWVKRNPMPESADDRPAVAVEYVFMFTKSERYFYDAESVKMPVSLNTHPRSSASSRYPSSTTRDNERGRRCGVNPKAATSALGSKQNAQWAESHSGEVSARNRRNSDCFFESLDLILSGEDLPSLRKEEEQHSVPQRESRVQNLPEQSTSKEHPPKNASIHSIASGESATTGVSTERQGKGRGSSTLHEASSAIPFEATPVQLKQGGKGVPSPLQTVHEREADDSQCPGASRQAEELQWATDGGAMGGDTQGVQPPMRLLPSEKSSDNRSPQGVKRWWTPCGWERATRLLKLQFPKTCHGSQEMDEVEGRELEAYRENLKTTFQGMLSDDDGEPIALIVNPKGTTIEHFASYPPKLVEPLIKSSSSDGGCCKTCGANFKRVMADDGPDLQHQKACGGDSDGQYVGVAVKDYDNAGVQNASDVKRRILAGMRKKRTVGFWPTCNCGSPAVPCRVLDPFSGTGCTMEVATRLGRASLGCEISDEYFRASDCRDGQTGMHLV